MAAESCTNLKTLYEETVIPLNAELKRQLVDAVIALL